MIVFSPFSPSPRWRKRATVAAISRVISVPHSVRVEQCARPYIKTKGYRHEWSTIIKSARNTPNAPQDLGPHTQSVKSLLPLQQYCRPAPVDLKRARCRKGYQAQARQCLTNIQAIVQSIATAWRDMVKVTLFLADIADLDAVNAVSIGNSSHSLPTAQCSPSPVCRSACQECRWTPCFSTGKAPFPRLLPAAQDLSRNRPRLCRIALQPERRLLPLQQQYRCPAAP